MTLTDRQYNNIRIDNLKLKLKQCENNLILNKYFYEIGIYDKTKFNYKYKKIDFEIYNIKSSIDFFSEELKNV